MDEEREVSEGGELEGELLREDCEEKGVGMKLDVEELSRVSFCDLR